jgi:hypothetical protein
MKYIFEYGLWEKDFFLNELLPQGNVKYMRMENLENTQEKCDVFAFACRLHKFENIKKTIQKIKPKIILMTSDEFYQEDNNIFNQLGNECELFLRQYHHPKNTYTLNTIHIPLGYTNKCKVFSNQKRLKWSWFGELKNDRIQMLNEFKKLNPYVTGNLVSKELMCKSYSQSIFVPCGRGNSSLDCYRLYEASMNGAIPVVVGTKEEIECTFKYEENPPWIFAKNWKDAVEKCNHMLEFNSTELDVKKWWNNRVKNVRSKISEIL